MVSRRDLIGLGVASVGLVGCSKFARALDGDRLPKSIDLPTGDVHPTVRLLDRAGFGPRPGQVAEVQTVGLDKWLQRQLNPTEEEPAGLNFQLNRLDVQHVDGMELRDLPEDEMLRQLSQAAILRAVYSPWQLRERMVDFWTNHFNIYARKGLAAYRKPADDLNVVRNHALTSFPDLLKASAHSPAMLSYLDNRQNMRGVANENYARELMELHSLGVHGGYSQKDVQEVARCFTGWTVEDRFLRHQGAFLFDADRHDDGQKVVLGETIPAGGGQNDGERVLEILSAHPSCARFISGKLCRYFLGTTETPWHEKLAAIYGQTAGSIPAMLQPLLLSQEVLSGPPVAKRPFDYVVSSLRAVDAETDGGRGIQRELQTMGQPLNEWPMPDGYPDKTSAWTGSLLARWNFALRLVGGNLDNAAVDLPGLVAREKEKNPIDAMLALALPGRSDARDKVRASLALQKKPALIEEGADDHQIEYMNAAALCLCSPEFQWR